MKYLNLGCGYHYSKDSVWTNLDFISTGPDVVGHNLLKGIPFSNNSFTLVYHSHVLEHFSKEDGRDMLKECHRVLEPGGVIRIAVPDLERIAKEYLNCVEKGLVDPDDDQIRANYNWILLEMYDQTVRNFSGGEMLKYLNQDELLNEDFIYQRIGEEGKSLINNIRENRGKTPQKSKKLKHVLKSFVKKLIRLPGSFTKTSVYENIGKFRLQGEIHQWMYDRYSLTYILKQLGFEEVVTRDAFTSYIPNWIEYKLDGQNDIVRKPDSLFIEAIKR